MEITVRSGMHALCCRRDDSWSVHADGSLCWELLSPEPFAVRAHGVLRRGVLRRTRVPHL